MKLLWNEFNQGDDIAVWIDFVVKQYHIIEVTIVCPQRASIMGIFQVFVLVETNSGVEHVQA